MIVVGESLQPRPPPGAIMLALSRGDNFTLARDSAELRAGDRALIVIPLAPFREGKDTLAAADRFFHNHRDCCD